MHGHKYAGLFNLIPYWTFGLIQIFAITNSIINGLDHISLLTFGSLYDKFLQDELEVGPPVSVTPADTILIRELPNPVLPQFLNLKTMSQIIVNV